MPLERSEAYILRTFPVGEQDKIVVFFSREKGLLRGIAKGARKFGNRFGSSLEPLSRVSVFYYEKEHKDLVVVGNCDLIESRFDLPEDLDTSFMLSYFSELIEAFSPVRSQEDMLFRLLESVLQALKKGVEKKLAGAYFEIWILKISGLLPGFQRCLTCRREIQERGWLSVEKEGVYCDACTPRKKYAVPPALTEFLVWAKKNPPIRLNEVHLPGDKLDAIRSTLQSIIIHHMEKEPKSLRFTR